MIQTVSRNKYKGLSTIAAVLMGAAVFGLQSCGGGGGSSEISYTVGGTIAGLNGNGLVLQNNSSDNLLVAGVAFEFTTSLSNNAGYSVSILTQPVGQSCSVINGSGVINGSNVTDISATCRGWGAPELIETDNVGDASGAHLAIDSAGNALALWSQRDSTRSNIVSNRYTLGSGWGAPELIETENLGGAHAAQIAFDKTGNAIAVWRQLDSTAGNIWSNRYTVGSGWGIAEKIETNIGDASRPNVDIDDNGNAIVVWQLRNGSHFDVWSNHYTLGVGWGTAELVEFDDSGSAISPVVEFDTLGNAMAVWHQNDGTRFNIMANRYVLGSGWGTAELIETNNDGSAHTVQVAIDGANNATAVWEHNDGTRDNIWANRYVEGSGWGAAVLIENNDSGETDAAKIVVDASGNAIAVWKLYDGSHDNTYANHYTLGVGWGSPVLIERDNTAVTYSSAIALEIAIDPSGNAIVIWEQDDSIRVNIWVNRYQPDTGWGIAELIETDDTGSAEWPKVAIDNNGNAIAIWNQYDGVRNNIWANRFE